MCNSTCIVVGSYKAISSFFTRYKNTRYTNQDTDTRHGRPQDLGGGGKNFLFFRFVNLHVAKRHAAHGEAMHIARGFGGMLPREKF